VTNLWIGNSSVVSSLCKDTFENLFYVLSGEKIFTLCPPADAIFLQEEEFPSASFVWDEAEYRWTVQVDGDGIEGGVGVRWVEPDVQGLLASNHDEEESTSKQQEEFADSISLSSLCTSDRSSCTTRRVIVCTCSLVSSSHTIM